MLLHSFNPSTREATVEDQKFKVILNYTSFLDENPCGKAQDQQQQLPALEESVGVLSRLFPIACSLET
ncbi:hypothetical protein ACRRTK_018091 [Alexandromys fortis]